MHPCLQIDDIVRVIAAHVYSSSERPDHLKALCNMALTCRTFCEPALEERWRCVVDIDRLANCLPDELLDVTINERYGYDVTIKRIPLLHQWERVHYYARFVREFHMSGSWERLYTSDFASYIIFGEHYPRPCLFPRLVDFRSHGPVEFKQMKGFLERIIPDEHPMRCVQTRGEHRDAGVLVELIRLRTPRLAELELVVSRPRTTDAVPLWMSPSWMSRFICSLTHLTHLRINTPFDVEAMQHIAYLPYLTSLGALFMGNNFPPLMHPQPAHSPPAFVALRELDMHVDKACNDAGRLTTWLHSIGTPPRLRSCKFSNVILTAPHQLDALVAEIAQFTTLERLNMHFGYDAAGGELIAREEALLPLLDNLHHIQSFGLESGGVRIHLSPSFPVKMASAWPDLVSLHMLPWAWSPELKADDLLSFAAFCPKLLDLEFPVSLDLPAIPTMELDEVILEQLEDHDPPTSVTSISFLDDPQLYPRTIEFLAQYFPSASFRRWRSPMEIYEECHRRTRKAASSGCLLA